MSLIFPTFNGRLNCTQAWYYYLCEYMMSYQTPFVRRQVRKLLLFICGNKEKYRQLRDVHALVSHVQVNIIIISIIIINL